MTGSKLVCGCGLVWLRDLVRRKPSVVTEARYCKGKEKTVETKTKAVVNERFTDYHCRLCVCVIR